MVIRYLKHVPFVVLCLGILTLLSACASTQQWQKVGRGQEIDMGRYSVTAPRGDGWEMTSDKAGGTLELHRLEKGLFRGVTRGAFVSVFQKFADPNDWLKGEMEIADAIRGGELKDMNSRGVQTGEYALLDGKKDEVRMGGRDYYILSYTTKLTAKPVDMRDELYIYFPPDFKETHIAYEFVIGDLHERSDGTGVDLEELRSVISSLQIDTSDAAYIKAVNAFLPKAAASGDAKSIAAFIDRGADINVMDEKGFTSLMLASSYGRVEVAKLLLDKGADVNAVNEMGSTALFGAVIFGHANIVNLLISYGADVNVKDKKGHSALYIAKIQRSPDIIGLLEKAGAKE